ncbi:hypothetical protein [Luteibacter sp. 9135]|uniref:hypothetical protein n=1 Tax=Luteibacter sp. 9135 TaxID=1500893 RepID=UPI0016396DAA|nr:hypothetical protein [Luteibacter sp. 9135]
MPEKITFKYGKLPLLALLLSAAVFAMAAYAFFRAAIVFTSGDLIYFLVGIPFVIAFVTFPMFAYQDVVVSSEGIGRSFFGVPNGFVSWDKITSVRCGDLSAADRSVGNYHLRVGNRAIFGGVRVMTMIDDVEMLVARIDAEVSKRAIPITAWDVNKLVTLDRLPSPKKGAAAWS